MSDSEKLVIWDGKQQVACIPEDEAREIGAEVGMVPIRELQALVESWEGTDTDPTLYRDSLTRAIKELEEVIEAYE